MLDPIIQTPEDGTGEVKPETEIKPAEPVTPAAPATDWEEKFKQSSRENQILNDAQKAREKADQELTKEPTESELRTAFPEWEALTDFEKSLAQRQLKTERLAAQSAKTAGELSADRSWNTSIDLAIAANEQLLEKAQPFRQFALQPKYRGAPMELIVGAFLGTQSTNPPSPRPTPKPGLEPGNGGPRSPDKPQLLTSSQLQSLRKSDEKAYLAYIKKHDVTAMTE